MMNGANNTNQDDQDPDQSLESDITGKIGNDDEETGHSGSSAKNLSSGESEDKLEVAKTENLVVFRLRLLVFFVILLAAISVSLLVYYITSNAEQDEYKTQYEGAAQKVIDSFLDVAGTRLGVISSLAVTLTSQGTDQGPKWPFVTLSNFQQRVATIRSQSGAAYVHVNPFVMEGDRKAWEEFLVGDGSHWLEEGLTYQDEIGLFDYENAEGTTATIPDSTAAPVTHGDDNGMEGHEGHTVAPTQSSSEWHTDMEQGDHMGMDGHEGPTSAPSEGSAMVVNHTMPMNHTMQSEGSHNMSSQEMPNSQETSMPMDHSMHRHLQDTTDGDANHVHSDYVELVGEDSWNIWYHNKNKEVVYDEGPGPYMPTYQSSPIFYSGHETNENILKSYGRTGGYKAFSNESAVISEFLVAPRGDRFSADPQTALYARLLSAQRQENVDYQGDAFSQFFVPIFDSLQSNKTAVGVVVAWVHWMTYFTNILPSSLEGIFVVMSDSCTQSYTYQINGALVTPLGVGDRRDNGFDDMRKVASFANMRTIEDGTKNGLSLYQDDCVITIDVYPSQAFYDSYNTNTPFIMAALVASIFIFTALLFFLYDKYVEKRQNLVMESAERTNRIVSSLFPENVRERLMQQTKSDKARKNGFSGAPNRRLKGFLTGSEEDDINAAPIADLFPHCTVMFADISGFTAWSSTRDPSQVFVLLQTVYQAFDKIAKRRKVFKVETIGDSYVAVTGLPEPQSNHAVIMSRFASECNIKMGELTSRLENTLGPDTADLAMRFGMHSGPVTAGVLRGDRARFQLFGDTVNTAARMESTGVKKKIQISPTTYTLLCEQGKDAWTKPRADAVHAKGLGILTTYWLDLRSGGRSSSNGSGSVGGSSYSGDEGVARGPSGALIESSTGKRRKAQGAQKQARLVNWIVDMVDEHIRKLLAQRGSESTGAAVNYSAPQDGKTPLDYVAEIIYLPRFDKKAFAKAADYRSVQMDPTAAKQLHQYVSIVASFYNANPFHNFEHACHVTMATDKFLKRIVAPDIAINNANDNEIANELHNYTHGINSDPLTILAILFSALIHDAGHEGVSNQQLASENPELKNKYNDKSVAEQNSLDISWDLLMQDRFGALRNCLFATSAELKRFRQVLVNVVLATDIFDKELNGLRKSRWEKAFSSDGLSHDENNDLRATIVIEHIIQASDVSHTMQHWHIYRKWNARLFEELYVAYREGRMGKDPSTFWYQGEIGFFDNYIIPLAKKLKDCRVFGVSSHECLNYAERNRNEWKERGEEIVKEMLVELVPKVEAYLKSKETAAAQPPEQQVAQTQQLPMPMHLQPTPAPTYQSIVEC